MVLLEQRKIELQLMMMILVIIQEEHNKVMDIYLVEVFIMTVQQLLEVLLLLQQMILLE